METESTKLRSELAVIYLLDRRFNTMERNMLPTHLVFVYGTLKSEQDNHHILSRAEFIGPAYTVDAFKMTTVGFPVLHRDDNGLSVYGEVYRVDDHTLQRLDQLEAEGHMYNRERTNVVYIGGRENTLMEHGVFIYIGHPDYWHHHSSAPYTSVNEHAELEWRP